MTNFKTHPFQSMWMSYMYGSLVLWVVQTWNSEIIKSEENVANVIHVLSNEYLNLFDVALDEDRLFSLSRGVAKEDILRKFWISGRLVITNQMNFVWNEFYLQKYPSMMSFAVTKYQCFIPKKWLLREIKPLKSSMQTILLLESYWYYLQNTRNQ